MFTGIVQGTAQLIEINEKPGFRTHTILMPEKLTDSLEPGASVAHNGCCLTVIRIEEDRISFNLVQETLEKTNLGDLKIGGVKW